MRLVKYILRINFRDSRRRLACKNRRLTFIYRVNNQFKLVLFKLCPRLASSKANVKRIYNFVNKPESEFLYTNFSRLF